MKKDFIHIRLLGLLLLFTTMSGSLFSQAQLANEEEIKDSYFYIDSSKVYLQVVERGYRSPQVLQKLADSYYFKAEYQEALRWYQELFKSYPNEAYPERLSKEHYLHAARSAKALASTDLALDYIGQYSVMGGDPKLVQAFLK